MKYIADGFYKSDKEFLQFIISNGGCKSRSNEIRCNGQCYICKVHIEEYGHNPDTYSELVEYCKELLKRENPQLEFNFEV